MKKLLIPLLLQFWCLLGSSQVFFEESLTELVNEEVIYGSIPSFHGPGISFMDFDNDGWDDITIPASADQDFQFLRNTGGQFEIIELPISSEGIYTRQVLWVDFDNDGDNDFFATSEQGRCWFYRNDGGNNFTDILAASGIATQASQYWGVSWGDYDNDGDLDVFLSVRDPERINYNLLYRNENNGTFTDVTLSAGLASIGYLTQSAAFIDYDRDGFQDLFLANDKDELPNILYRNRGNGTFQDVSIASGMDLFMDAMSTTVEDYNNDGWLDIYVTNIYPPALSGSVLGNAFLLNNGDGTFSNIAQNNGTRYDGYGWGAVFLDSENDGDLDLFVSSQLDGSDGRPPSAYYENNGNGNYTIPSNTGFINNIRTSHGNAIGDIQNDGLPDIAVVNIENQPIDLWVNQTVTQNNWLKIKLQGTQSNRMGIGSYIEIGVGEQVFYRYTMCGEGFISQNSLSEFFGIGAATEVDYVEVTWLSGLKDRFENVTSNQLITLVEGSSPVENNGNPNGGGNGGGTLNPDWSIARHWNEVLLDGIRLDLSRPTVHARNLFHSSLAMYDAWALFDNTAETVFLGKTFSDFYCGFEGILPPGDIEAARHEVLSYALYRLLSHRFSDSPRAVYALQKFNTLFTELGYDPTFKEIDYSSGSYAALGNYLAAKLIEFGYQDGANEENSYENQDYNPVNSPLSLENYLDVYELNDPNRWQPLAFESFIDQSGNLIEGAVPEFLSPEWGKVTPFALKSSDLEILNNGFDSYIYNNPGVPPGISNSSENGFTDPYKWHFALVASWSSHLDPNDPTLIDISPGALGNVDIALYPETFEEYQSFYDFMEGGDIGTGHDLNPTTQAPYVPQLVKRADYARVLAEFWADGPDSETPPGHWFTILNYVSDHPETVKQFGGEGSVVSDLEWDVKSYLALGGAMHDAAVNAWGIKGYYDYIRPISAIRYMASNGQSTNASLPGYHPQGLPLIPGRIELIESGDPLAGVGDVNVGKIKIYAWKGPDFINNASTDIAGVDWILGTRWWPYQRPTFVTPPFAGYLSGHSTFSRAAAEVLTLLTGDPYFPGGLGIFDIEQNNFLVFENGPSENLTLQWATYRDASDQTSLSRIWGGIHPPIDDIPGRKIGDKIGKEAFGLAQEYFEGLVNLKPDNFLVKTIGESCLDLNDGAISIDAEEYYNYVALINGQEYSFNREIIIENLAPGMYTMCLRVENEPTFEQCYDLNIPEVQPLDVTAKTEFQGLSSKTYFDIDTGTPPFVLTVNNEVKGTFENKQFSIPVNNGDLLSLKSSLPCEGEYLELISFTDKIIAYPNPTSKYLNLPGISDKSLIEVYTIAGQMVKQFKGKNPLDLSFLSNGVYFIKIRDGESTSQFKVIVSN